ncbi:MAG: hypothetical protein ACFFAS_15715 [Promethearchaeota archaeon]
MYKEEDALLYRWILILTSFISLVFLFVPNLSDLYNTISFSFGLNIIEGNLALDEFGIIIISACFLFGSVSLVFIAWKYKKMFLWKIPSYCMMGGFIMIIHRIFILLISPAIMEYIYSIFLFSFFFPILIGTAINKEKDLEIFLQWVLLIISFMGFTSFLLYFIETFYIFFELKYFIYILPAFIILFGTVHIFISAVMIYQFDSSIIVNYCVKGGLLMIIGVITYIIAKIYNPFYVINKFDFIILINFCIPILLGLYFLNY